MAEDAAQLALVEQLEDADRAADRGVLRVRPVAKALGAIVGDTYSRGTGCCATADSSRTMRYIAGCSASVTGWARIARIASLSEFQ